MERWTQAKSFYGVRRRRYDLLRREDVRPESQHPFRRQYSEVSGEQLAKLAPFHQILLFGDYAQDSRWHQPCFDFVRRCGEDRVSSRRYGALSSQLFDVVSLLAYDGMYRFVPMPNDMPGFQAPSAIKTLFAPDHPQAEVLAMWCVAKRNSDRLWVTIVVDREEARAAAEELRKHEKVVATLDRGNASRITIMSSDELRGHECDVIIFAAAALDRADLSTTELLERLIVIFGRARMQVEVVLPKSDIVGSLERRCTCLLQPLLSYQLAPREAHDTQYHDLSRALAGHGFSLVRVDGCLIVLRLPTRCLIIVEGEPDPRYEIATTLGWKSRHIRIAPELLVLAEDELAIDHRFQDLVARLAAIK